LQRKSLLILILERRWALLASNPFKQRDVISTKDFSRKEIDRLLRFTARIKGNPSEFEDKLKGRLLASLFFEPSTRTRTTFRLAARRLGMIALEITAEEATSMAKGENLRDTLKMYEGYGVDVMVIRHPSAGTARYASKVVRCPVINAGDGPHEHPTQAFLDLFTIEEEFGRVDGLSIGMMGDLRYSRTVSSLSYALSNYETELFFIAPRLLQIDQRTDGMELYLRMKDVKYRKLSEVEEVMGKLDVLYVTRIQRERFPDELEYKRVRGSYRVDAQLLEGAKEELAVLHPLPRVDEITHEVDASAHAKYYEQAANGLYLRMALLLEILG
jgi:aspartate carbamoyltransferase catalytic subunit